MSRRWLLIAAALAAFPHAWQVRGFSQQSTTPGNPQTSSPSDKPDVIEIPLGSSEESDPSVAPALPAVRIVNYASCSVAELQHAVPELGHLKAAADQSQLNVLLDEIGGKTVEIAHKTPNLISNEAVVFDQGGVLTRQSFSFLVLPHAMGSNGIVFDEYRVDLASGEKFQTEDFEKTATSKAVAPSSSPLELPSLNRSATESEAPPKSQGFVNDWLYFYPSNRGQSEFRYLGQQKLDGHHTLVVAFAQRPGLIRLPAMIAFGNKTSPIFRQGVAWVDESDFRIVRLRTDLLVPPPGIPLRQLTADIQFAQFTVAEIASPLWLPRQVVVTSQQSGMTIRETHTYSNYRLFRAHSKVVLNP